MRSFVRRAVTLTACFASALVWAGCEGKQATEYVTGVSTQVSVPRDLKAVRIEVTVGGFSQFCRGYKVYDGKVKLPGSLGSFPNTDEALKGGPLTYTVVGLTEEFDEASPNPLFAVCAQPKVGQNNARILRRSRQPYVPESILFLPMPLKYACYDKDCGGDDMTCKAGKCVNATLSDDQIKALPKYEPELLDGTGSGCFSLKTCMPDGAPPAIPVNADDCTYAVPKTSSAPAIVIPGAPDPFAAADLPAGANNGVNVQITYDGGLNREVLDLDPEEGFIIADPNKPQQFKLAPGLCEMVKGIDDQNKPTAHRITSVNVSGFCAPKGVYQPICAADQLKAMGLTDQGVIPNPPPADLCTSVGLNPPRAGLVVVVDNTVGHNQFQLALNASGIDPNDEDTFVEPAINTALSDPAFNQTDIGLVYAGNAGVSPQCLATIQADVPLGPAAIVRDPIITKLKNDPFISNPTSSLSYEGALSRAYASLDAQPDYFRKAVLIMGNSAFNADTCEAGQTPVSLATNAAATKNIQTYVMQLTKNPPPDGTASLLAQAGGTTQASYKTVEANTKFAEIVNSLATCVYETPANQDPKPGDLVSFSHPLTAAVTTVENNGACNTEAGSKTDPNSVGWGSETLGSKQRVYLCAKTCDTYRTALREAKEFAALYGQEPLAMPVFAFKKACQ